MVYMNENGGILKEESNKRRGTSKTMSLGAPSLRRVLSPDLSQPHYY